MPFEVATARRGWEDLAAQTAQVFYRCNDPFSNDYSQLPAAVRSGIAEAWRKGKLDHVVSWVVSDSAASSHCLDVLTKLRDGGVQGLAVRAYDMQPVPGKERLETAGAISTSSS